MKKFTYDQGLRHWYSAGGDSPKTDLPIFQAEVADCMVPPHVHNFRGPIGPSKYVPGATAGAVCECGAEIIEARR